MLVHIILHRLPSSMIIVYISLFVYFLFLSMRLFCVCIDTRLMRTQESTIQSKIMIITNGENCSFFFVSLRSLVVYSSLLFINETIFFPFRIFAFSMTMMKSTLSSGQRQRDARSLARFNRMMNINDTVRLIMQFYSSL